MQQTNNTVYTLNINGGSGDGGQLVFGTASGADDAFILALASAIKGVTWPSGEAPVQVQATKNVQNDVTYSGDLATSPATFT